MSMNDYAADQDLVHSRPDLQKVKHDPMIVHTNLKDKHYVEGAGDAVNHPSHYTSGRFEVIDIIEDQLEMNGLRGFCLGNALKYICRAGKKGGSKEKMLQDLEKAVWYINHYVQREKEEITRGE